LAHTAYVFYMNGIRGHFVDASGVREAGVKVNWKEEEKGRSGIYSLLLYMRTLDAVECTDISPFYSLEDYICEGIMSSGLYVCCYGPSHD
jgi:hypothetical protein